jgi:hypothetical protein
LAFLVEIIRRPPSIGVQTTITMRPDRRPTVMNRSSGYGNRQSAIVYVKPGENSFRIQKIDAAPAERIRPLRRIEGDLHPQII